MDNNDQKAKYDDKKDGEYNNYGDVVDAVPAADDGPPIPPGHQRFFCEKCRAPYDLPQGATSWRCAGCSTFNSTTPMQCPCCVVM
ncbi:hypothetical protein FRACYDRAFT_276158 [Fragilariopsis cylindrus CCMP1102]|uniref:RanBP2-type domain-containing protein n=1 Tax=Fragilariopsis cylindrus CCMP1102 TaxID=635003 RepID=A0A1E7F6J0_9STRA|nr:hypothetical protein FRACYDRAFT_276158 [Fragilariopsis cylindrus CCMP1102]|eukprot:OEU13802.1 hypothetical protein FRACYDRAFT_276158 [Fragilariopsis cylindrus CCMP1102]